LATPIISETREQCAEKVTPVGRRSCGASPRKRLGWSLALSKIANDSALAIGHWLLAILVVPNLGDGGYFAVDSVFPDLSVPIQPSAFSLWHFP
jgi:hypothetical protein